MGRLLRLFTVPEEAVTLAYNRGRRDYRLGIHLCPYSNQVDLMLAWDKGYMHEKEKGSGQEVGTPEAD